MNVLLYVLDSLRPDRLSCYGHDRRTSPTIDALADDAVRFTNAFAQGIWTAPTSGSIVTGLYPTVHGAEIVPQPLAPEAPRLPVTLSREGLTTGAVSTIDQVSKFRGYDRGFDEFVELFRDCAPDDPKLTAELHDRIDGWLDARDPEEDWFLFAWSLGTHTPHTFPGETAVDGEHPRFVDPDYDGSVDGSIPSLKAAGQADADRVWNLYDSSIRYNDALLGELIDRLQRAGVYDETMIIVTADHGELVDEHGRLEQCPAAVRRLGRLPGVRRVADRFDLFEPSGFVGHSSLLPYDELIRVPLVVKFPEGRHAGEVVDSVVESIDVFPTAAEVVGADPPKSVQGRSLLSTIRDRPTGRCAFSESRTLEGSNRYRSVRDREHKFIEVAFSRPGAEDLRRQPRRVAYSALEAAVGDRRLLFEINDPDERGHYERGHSERENCLSDRRHVGARLGRRLAEWREANDRVDLSGADQVRLDSETKSRLSSLGYVD